MRQHPAPGHSSLETMTEQAYRGVPHTPWAKDGKVFLSNDEDSQYTQEFHSREEVQAFAIQLLVKASEAWPLDCEKALAQEDYRSLCAELINSIHASRCTQMGWTEEKEDELLKRAALAVGEGYFTPTAWNILAQ